MVKKVILVLVGALVIGLVLTSVALAATPQDIYDDYADNGQLDGTYTDAELQAYLDDATIQQYGDPSIVGPLDALVESMLTPETETFPFTGFQLMIAGIVAVCLVGGGIALRRISRTQKS